MKEGIEPLRVYNKAIRPKMEHQRGCPEELTFQMRWKVRSEVKLGQKMRPWDQAFQKKVNMSVGSGEKEHGDF